MATSTVTRYHQTTGDKQLSCLCNNTCPDGDITQSPLITCTTCALGNFPKKFQDFFAATLTDDTEVDLLSGMLEDKLIPRKHDDNNAKDIGRNDTYKRWAKRSFHRRSSEIEVHLMKHRASVSSLNTNTTAHTNTVINNNTKSNNGQSDRVVTASGSYINNSNNNNNSNKSPVQSRRRSSSIAVTRPTPDLNRFLQTEIGSSRRGQTTAVARSPTRPSGLLITPCQTARVLSSKSQHFSPNFSASPCGDLTLAKSSNRFQLMDRTVYPTTTVTSPHNRRRTSSMPAAIPRHRPMLVETKRSHKITNAEESDAAEEGIEYYRVRSFSITANGIFNLGDSLKSRRSRSNNSVVSSDTSCSSTRDGKLPSSASQYSCFDNGEIENTGKVATYKVGMLGASGVGKTALTAQFATSEYICAYDASLDDEYDKKNVSVMIDGQEAELEIIDHPASEMSIESFCSTYNPDIYVVVYSVVDRSSLKIAEEILLYLWKNDYMLTHGVILVGNKVDLERKREVMPILGRRLANSCGCKFIETSSGLAHHVDELLVGILAQIKLNPQRNRDQTSRRKRCKYRRRRILKHLLGIKKKTKSCENLFTL